MDSLSKRDTQENVHIFQVEVIDEHMDYTELDLLSAFGGFLGMLIGASVLSIYDDMIDLAMKMIHKFSKHALLK